MNAEKTNYDLLYNPRLVVADYQQIFDRWEGESERARASLDCYLDVPYGAAETEKLDIFKAQGTSKGLLVYIHGGYWRSLDKKRFSFIAPALVSPSTPPAPPPVPRSWHRASPVPPPRRRHSRAASARPPGPPARPG